MVRRIVGAVKVGFELREYVIECVGFVEVDGELKTCGVAFIKLDLLEYGIRLQYVIVQLVHLEHHMIAISLSNKNRLIRYDLGLDCLKAHKFSVRISRGCRRGEWNSLPN